MEKQRKEILEFNRAAQDFIAAANLAEQSIHLERSGSRVTIWGLGDCAQMIGETHPGTTVTHTAFLGARVEIPAGEGVMVLYEKKHPIEQAREMLAEAATKN